MAWGTCSFQGPWGACRRLDLTPLTGSALEAVLGLGAWPAAAHGVLLDCAFLLGLAPTSWGVQSGAWRARLRVQSALPQARSPLDAWRLAPGSFQSPGTVSLLVTPRGQPWASFPPSLQPVAGPSAPWPDRPRGQHVLHPTPRALGPPRTPGGASPTVVWGESCGGAREAAGCGCRAGGAGAHAGCTGCKACTCRSSGTRCRSRTCTGGTRCPGGPSSGSPSRNLRGRVERLREAWLQVTHKPGVSPTLSP